MSGFIRSSRWLAGCLAMAAVAAVAAIAPEASVYIVAGSIATSALFFVSSRFSDLVATVNRIFDAGRAGITWSMARLANLVGVIFRGGDGNDTPDGGGQVHRKVTGFGTMGSYCSST